MSFLITYTHVESFTICLLVEQSMYLNNKMKHGSLVEARVHGMAITVALTTTTTITRNTELPNPGTANSNNCWGFPSHKNMTFLTTHTNILTLPQWEETSIEVKQLSTSH